MWGYPGQVHPCTDSEPRLVELRSTDSRGRLFPQDFDSRQPRRLSLRDC
jgi:hypothetical protein